MAQPNVAREPSMEEILASIRRIIESNDPGAADIISSSLPPLYALSENEAEEADPEEETADEDEFGASLTSHEDAAPMLAANASSVTPAGEQPTSPEPQRSVSLADVAARVRAASERAAQRDTSAPTTQRDVRLPPNLFPSASSDHQAAEPAQEEGIPQAMHPEVVHMPEPESEPEAHLTEPQLPVAEQEVPAFDLSELASGLDAEEPVSGGGEEQPQAPAYAPEEHAHHEEQPEVVMEPAPSFRPSIDPFVQQSLVSRAQPEMPPLRMSEEAGAQVARSFEELAEAIDGSQRRSLDEIAQEMLRPLLQDWLDDNLPTIVERLVREEIERVARGPRRN